MSEGGTPRFGELLAPVLGRVPPDAVPRFLALLERTAADRYRGWAEEWPQHGDVLLACAGREDEIADRIDAAFACDDHTLEFLRGLLPEARDIYYRAFDGYTVAEQLALQAEAELQGAAAWRGIADRLGPGPGSAALAEALATCSELEECSSLAVAELLATAAPGVTGTG